MIINKLKRSLKLFLDDGACSIRKDRLVTCPGVGNNQEQCLFVGCCWIPNGDGLNHNCFVSKSNMDSTFVFIVLFNIRF